MRIDTTIYISKDNVKFLQLIADKSNCSKNCVINSFLKRLVKPDKSSFENFKPVSYQSNANSGKWHRLHVSLDITVYETAIAFRNALKCSVSLLIANLIQKYKEQELNDTDNYPQSYISIITYRNNIPVITTIFGIIDEKHLIELLE